MTMKIIRPALLLGLLLLPSCVSQSSLDQRLEWMELNKIQRDMLEVQREQLLLVQQRRR
jgi:hypothetical protein